MRRQIIVVFLSLFWTLAAPAFGADRGALFKVTGNGHSMYLFGTIHMGQPGFFPLEPRIAAAVAGASALALEVDPLNKEAAESAMKAHGMATAGASIEKLTPAFKNRLNKALDKAGLEASYVAQYKPWLVATILAIAEYAAQGYSAELSVDAHLALLAKANKVPIIELETPFFQLGMFNRLSEAEQLHFLEESIALIETGKQGTEVRQIVDAWRKADRGALDAIAQRVDTDTSMGGKFVKTVMLDERNVVMADKLAALLQRSDRSVAAIGVLHLLGSNSVPALMKARGLTVERVY